MLCQHSRHACCARLATHAWLLLSLPVPLLGYWMSCVSVTDTVHGGMSYTPIAAALAAPARDHLGHIGPGALPIDAHCIAQQVVLLHT